MRGKFALPLFLAALLSGTAAHAGMIGDKVHGNITHLNGSNIGEDGYVSNNWGTDTIGRGFEFIVHDDFHRYKANFRNNRLVFKDKERPRETYTGWNITFRLLDPEAFKSVSLRKSDFGKGFTYSVKDGVLDLAWTGDAKYADMTRRERRELGPQKFKAVFNITTDDPTVAVPEPGTLALFGTAMLAAFAFAFRKRRAAAPQSSRLIS
jgi:hypothetical protein